MLLIKLGLGDISVGHIDISNLGCLCQSSLISCQTFEGKHITVCPQLLFS